MLVQGERVVFICPRTSLSKHLETIGVKSTGLLSLGELLDCLGTWMIYYVFIWKWGRTTDRSQQTENEIQKQKLMEVRDVKINTKSNSALLTSTVLRYLSRCYFRKSHTFYSTTFIWYITDNTWRPFGGCKTLAANQAIIIIKVAKCWTQETAVCFLFPRNSQHWFLVAMMLYSFCCNHHNQSSLTPYFMWLLPKLNQVLLFLT